MTETTLTKTRLFEGVWEGVLRAPEATRTPSLKVTLEGADVLGVDVRGTETPGEWLVRVPVPMSAVRDGVQTFLVTDAATGEVLNSFAILAGDSLTDSLNVEVDLLRAELDLLKRAFRRHCVETT